MVDIVQASYPNRKLKVARLAPCDRQVREVVTVNAEESPLGWLASRGMISQVQVSAGETLRADFFKSGLAARVTMRWDMRGSAAGHGGGADLQILGAVDAKRRFDAALAAVGPGLSDILWRVVCEGEGLTVAEKGLGWPTRAGKLVLGLALDRLAMHYNNQYG